jgi:2-hydroxychromene-2-carboxylate isomerase
MDRIVDYYFVPQSPWTYLGHAGFAALVRDRGLTARVKPLDAGRLFAASGGLPLAQRPVQRRSYRLLELTRFAKRLALPLNLNPRFFPVIDKPASLQIVAATRISGEDAAMDLAFAFQRAVWAEERDIADPATIDAIVADCGLDAGAIRACAATAEVAARFEANTQEGIDGEVFGVPTYVPRFGAAKDERFWGQDRIELLAWAIDG